RPVVPEARGEIFIHGPGEAIGYWNRPDLTAERFVPHPYGRAGERVYRTGDVARRRADGALEFVGRIDHQIKVRGFRVEIGEIEHKIKRNEGVNEVVVVASGSTGELTLTAYVQLQRPDVLAGIRSALAKELPDPMIPRNFVAVN